jgi:4-aminobutyrate aminotransferase-like enzyme
MLPALVTPIPGSRSLALAAELSLYECRNTTYLAPDFPVFWERAHGTNVWDVDGNRYLDLTSGFGVAGLGYTPQAIVQAATEQLQTLYHAMGDVHPAAEKVALCRLLSELTFENWGVGTGKTILTNSGAEAIEAALKTAFLATGKPGVLTFEGAYHGLTYGSLTVSGMAEFRDPFEHQLANLRTAIPFPTCDSCSCTSQERATCRTRLGEVIDHQLTSENIGAILTEPIQGRAGVRIPPSWFLPLLREKADAHRILLIIDEIYTGFYRTGSRFACDQDRVIPDLLCLGKALTSGFPLAACVGRAAFMDAWPPSKGEALHTSTFLGNPLGCRMALTALHCMEQDHLSWDLPLKGELIRTGLTQLHLGPVRGRGLLWGLEVANATLAGRFVTEGLSQGLLLLSGGMDHRVITLTPPFLITPEELAWAWEKFAIIGQPALH